MGRPLNHKPCGNRGADRGFALLTGIALMSLVLGFSVIIVGYVMSTRKAAKSLETQIYATQIAEAGLYKAIYCLNSTNDEKCGGVAGPDYSGETNVTLGTGRFTSAVTGTGTDRTVTVTGSTPGGLRKTIRANLSSLPPYQPSQFINAVQAGDQGISINNQAIVKGSTVYANSNITCGSNVSLESNVYSSKSGAAVSYCRVYGSIWAHHVLYCIANNNITYSGTNTDSVAYGSMIKGVNPPTLPMPVLDVNYWRQRSERGGTLYGDQYPADDDSLGPVKIAGNLILNNGVTVNLEGPVWVTGNILMNENSTFNLDPSFAEYSTVVLADSPYSPSTMGKITVNPNAVINGSGNAKSFILMASTNTSLSDTNPAIDIGNNAGGGLFYAVNGNVRVRNNASATALAGSRVYIDQNGVIDFNSGLRDLSDLRFSVLPPGTWRMVEAGWREVNQ